VPEVQTEWEQGAAVRGVAARVARDRRPEQAASDPAKFVGPPSRPTGCRPLAAPVSRTHQLTACEIRTAPIGRPSRGQAPHAVLAIVSAACPSAYSFDHSSRRELVPAFSQQDAHRVRRVVLLSFNPFDYAAAPDFTRVAHADAFHYGTRKHVMTNSA
jgi:hypothetical protein